MGVSKHTTWDPNCAIPHGWAIAELWLLLRDCLAYENDNDEIVLLAGIDPQWFTADKSIFVKNMTTYYGTFSFNYLYSKGKAELELGGECNPPNGFWLNLPASFNVQVFVNKRRLSPVTKNRYKITGKQVQINFY